jgi:hypothetical protein
MNRLEIIHLHVGPGEGSQHSDLGSHLARALREYGMVEHTVWIEEARTHGERSER